MITALSEDDLYAYRAVVNDSAAATLIMRFSGLGTTVTYQGILQKAPGQAGLGKITLVPVDYVTDEQPSDSPPIAVDIDLDSAGGLTLERGEISVTLHWRTAIIDAELTVNCDPP